LIVAATGATGYVGRFIVKRLISEGVGVRAWRRSSSDLTGLPENVEWIDGDLSSLESARALVEGANGLVHAALDHMPGRYRGGEGDDPARFRKLNIEGSVALLEAARSEGVERAVVLSSRAVFGRSINGSIGDDDPVEPDTEYGGAKLALEDYVWNAGASGWPIAAIRPTGVYGIVDPVQRSKWFDLVNDAIAGNAVPARAGSEVHGDDVASAVWALLSAPPNRIAGRAFNCSDIVVSNHEIVRLVNEFAGTDGPLPDEGDPPSGMMRSEALKALSVTFGGRPLFEKTVAELVAAILRSR
jgi:nucleoside-diphosphate-sugar epimerase